MKTILIDVRINEPLTLNFMLFSPSLSPSHNFNKQKSLWRTISSFTQKVEIFLFSLSNSQLPSHSIIETIGIPYMYGFTDSIATSSLSVWHKYMCRENFGIEPYIKICSMTQSTQNRKCIFNL